MSKSKKQSKSDVIRKILKDQGAVTAQPPEGWFQKAQNALDAKKVKVHPSQIYGLRRSLLANIADSDSEYEYEYEYEYVDEVDETVQKVKEVIELSRKFGGLDGLAQCVATLQQISG